MAYKLAIAFSIIFTIIFCYLLFKSNNIFNTAWLVALISLPISLFADLVSRLLVIILGIEQKNIIIDLILLYLFGIVQYGAIGFISGLLVNKFIR